METTPKETITQIILFFLPEWLDYNLSASLIQHLAPHQIYLFLVSFFFVTFPTFILPLYTEECYMTGWLMQIIQLYHSLEDRKLSHLLETYFFNCKMYAHTQKKRSTNVRVDIQQRWDKYRWTELKWTHPSLVGRLKKQQRCSWAHLEATCGLPQPASHKHPGLENFIVITLTKGGGDH